MAGESYAIPPKDRAVEGIIWYIQSNGLVAGDRLPAERELCEIIGVSRTALRAAIARLVSCGNLESVARVRSCARQSRLTFFR